MKLFLIVTVHTALTFGRSIPDFIPQCSKNDLLITKCVLDGIETVKLRIQNGVPEIDLPSIEPFKMDILNVDESLIAFIKIIASIKNIAAYGGGNFTVKDLSIDLNNTFASNSTVIFPRLDITADYNAERTGALLLLPIGLNGKFKGSFSQVHVDIQAKALPVLKNGVEFLQLDTLVTKVAFDKVLLDFNANDSVRGRAATSDLPSPPFYLRFVRSIINKISASAARPFITRVMDKVPLKDVLTD